MTLFLGLLFCSITDIRRRTIPVIIPAAIAVFSAVVESMAGMAGIKAIIASIAITCIFLGISRITEQAIGYGDGFIIGAVIMSRGLYGGLLIVTTAFAFSALCALVLIVFRHVSGKYPLPFVPFLCAAYFAVSLVRGGVE